MIKSIFYFLFTLTFSRLFSCNTFWQNSIVRASSRANKPYMQYTTFRIKLLSFVSGRDCAREKISIHDKTLYKFKFIFFGRDGNK
jgi:hypothetical protein